MNSPAVLPQLTVKAVLLGLILSVVLALVCRIDGVGVYSRCRYFDGALKDVQDLEYP